MQEPSDNYQVWIGIGINTDTKCLTVLSFAMDKEECRERAAAGAAENGCTSFDVLEMLSKNFKSSMLLWLAENGIYGAEAAETVREFGKSMGQELKSLGRPFIGEKKNPQPGTREVFPPSVRRSGKLAAAADAALQTKPSGTADERR